MIRITTALTWSETLPAASGRYAHRYADGYHEVVEVSVVGTDVHYRTKRATPEIKKGATVAVVPETTDGEWYGPLDDQSSLALIPIAGAAVTGTLSTTQATTDLSAVGDGYYVGWWILVLTGTQAGELQQVSAFADTGGLLTFGEMAGAMADTDTFTLVP